MGVAALVTGAAAGAGAPQPPQSAFESHLLQLKSEASKLGRRQQLDFLAPQQSALGAAHDALGAAQLALGAQPLSQLFLQPNRPRLQQSDFALPQQSALGAAQVALGAAHVALGAAQVALGAQPLSQLFLQPNKPKPRLQQSDFALPQQSALGAAQLALGAAQVALGAAHVALGAAQLALGAQQLALGAQPQLLPSS